MKFINHPVVSSGLLLLAGALIWYSQIIRELLWAVPVVLFGVVLARFIATKQLQTPQPLSPVKELALLVGEVSLMMPLFSLVAPQLEVFFFVFWFIILSVLTEFCGILALLQGQNRRNHGPLNQSARLELIAVYCLVVYFYPIVLYSAGWVFGLACLFLILTVFNRLQGKPQQQPIQL